jgi:hypothetical protein
MSHENSQPTWNQVVRIVWFKTRTDYRTKVRPRMKSGRIKLGSLIETVGRRLKGSDQ